MNTISLIHRQSISLKERQQQPLVVLHNLSQQLVQQVLELVNQLEQLEQELEQLEVWEEPVLAWGELEAWEELVQVLIHLQEWEEWEAWAECQCSLVWQQAVDHLEWEEWVEQTWIPKWLTR